MHPYAFPKSLHEICLNNKVFFMDKLLFGQWTGLETKTKDKVMKDIHQMFSNALECSWSSKGPFVYFSHSILYMFQVRTIVSDAITTSKFSASLNSTLAHDAPTSSLNISSLIRCF